MEPIILTRQQARRFILGRQGLWPGRRWRGRKGTAEAILACESVQLDPLQATARSHDLVLHSRVLDYKPEHLERAMYRERRFFDYGGLLAVYPMEELPYWRHHMEKRSHAKRVEDFIFDHPGLFERVRQELRTRGPLGNRDLDGNAVARNNYRGRKDTSLAMYDMWISGELMIHHRDDFARIYDFRENVAPRELDHLAPEGEWEAFFAHKCIALKGLMPETGWKTDLEYYVRRKISRDEMHAWRQRWVDQGLIVLVQVEGLAGLHLALTEDVPILEALQAGKLPRAWKPLETSTLEEVTFLAPLDIVSARGRARKLFDFDYLWEVYKPAHQRRWGYYTLPILYGDELVARLDPKLDRSSMTLQIRGFWHEQHAPVNEPAFAEAFARGLLRFAGFRGAQEVNLSGVGVTKLRRQLKRLVGQEISVSMRSVAVAAPKAMPGVEA